MKIKNMPKILKIFIALIIFSIPLYSYSQKTFKVVCDKTDHTVKIIESENRSPNFVPIKGGFPFRQVAQKWIDENYYTTKCNPQQIINDIQKNKTKNAPAKSQAIRQQDTPTVNSANTQGNVYARAPAKPKFKNTSFLINAKFSTLGDAFSLNNALMKGFGLGIEKAFGGQVYFGSGINLDFFISDMDGRYNIDNEYIYFLRLPAFVGYRVSRNKITVMWETGAGVNSAFTGTELNVESFGKTANDYSVNLLGRMKIGTESVMLELGSELGLTEVFTNDPYKMTSVYIGLRMNF